MIDTGLKDKVALITSGNNPHGIGAAIARAFSHEGAKVFINYLRTSSQLHGVSESDAQQATSYGTEFYLAQSMKSADETLQMIREGGGQAEAREGDLTDPTIPPQLFDHIEKMFGSVDILVNVAAYSHVDTIFEITAQSIDKHFAVNTRASVLMMAEFAQRFKARKGEYGRIINTSTDSAQCFPTQISYGASKAAIEAYTRSVACEVARHGITVNTVALGPIQTGWLSEQDVKKESARIPLGRIGKPEDVANAVIFLASKQASWITGKVLRVDGGHIPFP